MFVQLLSLSLILVVHLNSVWSTTAYHDETTKNSSLELLTLPADSSSFDSLPSQPLSSATFLELLQSQGSGDVLLDFEDLQPTSSFSLPINTIFEYGNLSDFESSLGSIEPSSVSRGHAEPSSISSNSTSSVLLNENASEWEKRKTNANPSVDDIISGIIQLIGGNVKLTRPQLNVKLQQMNQHHHDLLHGTRINNRGPPKVSFIGPAAHQIPNLVPPSILIGPGRPAGLPLPFPPTHLPKLPVPLNIAPTKPALIIPESDVSFLLGLLKPNQIKEEVEIVPILQTKPKMDVSTVTSTIIENSLSNSTFNMQSFQVERVSESSISQSSSISTTILPQSETSKILEPEILSSIEFSGDVFSKELHSFSTPTSAITTGFDSESRAPSKSQQSNRTEIPQPSQPPPSQMTSDKEHAPPTGPVTAWVPIFLPPSLRTHGYQTEDEPMIITMPEEPSVFELTVKQQMMGAKTDATMPKIEPTPVISLSSPKQIATSEHVLTSSAINNLTLASSTSAATTKPQPSEPEIVYGKPASADIKPIAPSFSTNIEEIITLSASGAVDSKTSTLESTKNRFTQLGRPIVVPVEMDEVRPHVMQREKPGTNPKPPSIITESGKGSVYIDGRPTYFDITKPTAVGGSPTIQVGSGLNVASDTEDKQGKLQPSNSPTKPVIVRRPPFRPRPSVPLVRIDTCIVGDDSTCDMSLNEKCLTELGISSCQCRPGYARILARSPCVLVTSLALSIKVDRLNDKKLLFNRNFLNSNSEDYQYLEYEGLQAINSAFSLSNLARVFLGAKINRFYSVAGKTIINATINLELNNATSAPTIKRYVQQELSRVIAIRNNNVGESQLWVEGSLNAIPRVEDINECGSSDLNDCSKFAKCINDFGTFRCQCEPGYEDKFANDKLKSGRHCSACSPQYCSNRGECLVVNGQRECKCRGNFIGSKCDIDAEVLGVALGGSLAALIIIVITFLCLYMWNQRWKREQQKMEAMSAASGHTFSYVNKQAATTYRLTMDDRMRWAQIAEAMATNPGYAANYYAHPDHLAATSQQHHLHHVYATPSRVQTPDALLNEDVCAYESRQYARPLRPKSRSGYTLKNGTDSIYNETEFSTREMIYSPTHLIASPRSFAYS